LILLPSLNEGTPLALVEAMLCGRPSVVTDVGDNADWVREGVDGFIAGGANINAVDESLERAWSKRSEWASMGISAHNRAMSMIDPEPGRTLLNLILEHGRRP
jgi:glycosyltransferase involved in cell wall biosynthesis